jgi:hypothetical protein
MNKRFPSARYEFLFSRLAFGGSLAPVGIGFELF